MCAKQSWRLLTGEIIVIVVKSSPGKNLDMRHSPWKEAWYPVLRMSGNETCEA
jgi:hypothetical protein